MVIWSFAEPPDTREFRVTAMRVEWRPLRSRQVTGLPQVRGKREPMRGRMSDHLIYPHTLAEGGHDTPHSDGENQAELRVTGERGT